MNTELEKSILATNGGQEYDENVKVILAHKIILAHIMAETVEEFRGMKPEEIVPYIEGEPEVGVVPVEPGLTNGAARIQGSGMEDVVANEGIVTFDIRFFVRYPEDRKPENKKTEDRKSEDRKPENRKLTGESGKCVKLLLDVEAQKDFHPGYDIVVRGIYYGARQLSSQKGVEFEKSDYNSIKKVYSIWICMYPPKYCENTIIRFHMNQEVLFGELSEEEYFRYGLMEVLLVNLPLKVPQEEEEPRLTGMLKTLLSPEIPHKKKVERLENTYHVAMNREEKGEVESMCNLSEGIFEHGMQRGIEQGRAQGIEEGRTQGIGTAFDIIEKLKLGVKPEELIAEGINQDVVQKAMAFV